MKRFSPEWIASYRKFQIGSWNSRDEFFLKVIIPSLNEPDILGVLECLSQCDKPRYPVLVVVVLNYPEGSTRKVEKASKLQLEVLKETLKHRTYQWLSFTIIEAFDLPKKKAGVGLARKIGMDYAATEIDSEKDSVLVCLDADCRVASNYLTSIEAHFDQFPNIHGCSIFFSHTRNEETSGPCQTSAIEQYEMHLRLYTDFVRSTGAPFGFHTVGSSMAVRNSKYLDFGGMNVRKAGEDFYFLQKFMKAGQFSRLQKTTVYPSSRVSTRVPFGTGKAMLEVLNGNHPDAEIETYRSDIFTILGDWLNRLDQVYSSQNYIAGEPSKELGLYLESINAQKHIAAAIKNSSDFSSFRRQFYHFFDAFFIMKWANHAQRTWANPVPVNSEVRKFLINQNWDKPLDNQGDLFSALSEYDRALPCLDKSFSDK